MWIGIERFPEDQACIRCGRRNKITANRDGGPMYGDCCSYDCCVAAGYFPIGGSLGAEQASLVPGLSTSLPLVLAAPAANVAGRQRREPSRACSEHHACGRP